MRAALVTSVMMAALLASATRSGAQLADPQRFDRVAGISAEGARGFYQLLRGVVGRGEKAEVCALVAYPLAHADGNVASAADCVARYDALFTVDVRRAVGKAAFDDLFVNQRGMMFGMGELWVAGRCATPPCGQADLRIIAINSRADGLVPPAEKVLMSCRAMGQLLHVVADGRNGSGLRLWRNGRAEGPPTVTVPAPAETLKDPLCGAREWTFADETTRYQIGDLSCDAHLNPPPMGSVGELVVRRANMDDVRIWCTP